MPRSVIFRGFMLVAVLSASVLNAEAAAQTRTSGRANQTGGDPVAPIFRSGAASFLARWRNAWDARDVNALISLYTDDAAVRLPGRTMVRTRDSVETVLRQVLAGSAPMAAAEVEYTGQSDIAAVVSCYFTRLEGQTVAGLVTTVLQASGRSWRIRMQIFEAPDTESGGHLAACSAFAPRS